MNSSRFSVAARLRSSTNCSSSSDMVLKVAASSPISVRLFSLTRCEKSPRAMARLEAVRTSSGLVMRRAAKMLMPTLSRIASQRQQAGGALHLVHSAVGFVARLLHDHRPVQVA